MTRATLSVAGVIVLALGAALAANAAPASEGLKACLAKCNRSRLSETNRETCRLDCELDAATDPEAIQAEVARQHQPPPASPPASTITPPGRPVMGPAPTPSAPAGREGCKAQCDMDRSLSVDDRATCKLECDLVDDQPGAPPATPAGPASGPIVAAPTGPASRPTPPANLGVSPAGFLAMCLQTCRNGPVRLSATDQATCRLTCENAASVVDLALDAAPMWLSVSPAPTVIASPPVPARSPAPAPAVSAPASSCDAAAATCSGACEKVQVVCERGCARKHLKATDRETCKLDCGEGVGLCRADCQAELATCVNGGTRR